jgi:hypothetical protein
VSQPSQNLRHRAIVNDTRYAARSGRAGERGQGTYYREYRRNHGQHPGTEAIDEVTGQSLGHQRTEPDHQ